MVDWRARALDTTDAAYYKWTQWVFLQLFKRGLAYKKKARGELVPVRQDRARQRAGDQRRLRTLRHAGRAAVPGAVVLPHHRLRRPAARPTSTALDWSESTKTAQRNWIGRVGGRGAVLRGAGSDGVRGQRHGERRRPLRRGDFDAGGDPRVHDAGRHDLRRHLPGGGARASAASTSSPPTSSATKWRPTAPPRPNRTSSRAR